MSSKNDTAIWDDHRGKIYSTVGGWFGGNDVYCHGYSMMSELLGSISYMQMLVLNVTGRLIDEKLAKWLEGNFIGMSYPDPRIWCNQIGALCGTSRTTVTAATTAGCLAADSRAYGGSKTSLQGIEFIQQALISYKAGASIPSIIQQCKTNRKGIPVITGFARPVNKKDERIAPHKKMTEKLGFETGEHLKLAFSLGEYLEKHYALGINIGGYTSAFLSDQGFSGQEIYRIKAMCVASGVTACFIDAYHKPAETFLPLRCDDIEY
ncbi:MAG TPA: hypothetical protein ENK06_08740, partial [Gammaproteobacteria bacterium]|nr:hypothetical protein [Gammaproteobacteria bacterium]